MKKSFFILFVMNLVSATAFAYPSLNDTVLFKYKNSTIQFDNNGFHDGEWFVQATVDGWPQPFRIKAENMWTPAKIANLINSCEAKGGAVEMVTVPAGSFKTCKLRYGTTDEFDWYADVPFGRVQFTDRGWTYTLHSYVNWK